ncbi:bacteriohemerythrin [Thermophagus sp. OGC60D27]|uniref:bacteriohemerythrin n=1 Tax=Thermophagus sp. OGC60D27 TaxID=3458415 RepID=UPI004037EED3
MLIQWTEDLSVGNGTLDQEHQKWISLLNDFYEGLKAGKSKEKLTELVVGMLEYTKYHFADEERYMKSIHFPEFENHKAKHDFYIDKITQFYEKIQNNQLILSLEVTNFLKNWLINHIKGTDKKYAEFAKNI